MVGYYNDTSFQFGRHSTYVALTDSQGNASSPVNIYHESNNIENGFELFPPYPNPFNSSVKIEFSISEKGEYNLELYNVKGERVSSIIKKNLNPGNYSLNLINEFNSLATGTYFIRLFNFQNNVSEIQKIIYLK